MLDKLDFTKVLFLDIETVPQCANYEELPERFLKLWGRKSDSLKKNPDDTAETLYNRAGIYAEFGKIVCISVGMVTYRDTQSYFKVKSFYGDDESILLQEFVLMLEKSVDRIQTICGHNVKEFDVPYICRRLLINGLHIPSLLSVMGKKPWEVPFIDTMELWKFGDFKSYTSLDLLTAVFNIPTPKDDIDGSQVAEVYYKTGDVERIATYCEKDVFATAQLLLRLAGNPLIKEENLIK